MFIYVVDPDYKKIRKIESVGRMSFDLDSFYGDRWFINEQAAHLFLEKRRKVLEAKATKFMVAVKQEGRDRVMFASLSFAVREGLMNPSLADLRNSFKTKFRGIHIVYTGEVPEHEVLWALKDSSLVATRLLDLPEEIRVVAAELIRRRMTE